MPGLLDHASVMMCPHGGTVQATPSSTAVQIAGAPALTASDVFVIAGCAFVIATVPSPCVTVQWVQPAAQSTISRRSDADRSERRTVPRGDASAAGAGESITAVQATCQRAVRRAHEPRPTTAFRSRIDFVSHQAAQASATRRMWIR